jgi:hypothetical protein
VRAWTRRRDRAIAATAVAVGAAALFVGAGLAHGPVPALALNDPQATAQLLSRLRAGEHTMYVADYTLTRTNATGHFTEDELQARSKHFTLRRGGTSLLIDSATQTFDCELSASTPSCQATPKAVSLTPAQIVAGLTAGGVYDVVTTGSVHIAGESAACYRISATSPLHVIPDLGLQTDECLTPDGIRLRQRTETQPRLVDEWVARKVTRAYNATTVAPLLAGFDQTAPPLDR